MSRIKKIIFPIFKREMLGYFYAPIAYVYMVIFLSLLGVLTFVQANFFAMGEASLNYTFFKWHPWLYAFLVPAVGMRVWAEENRNGTIELLLSYPITQVELLIAKYLAGLALIWLTLFLSATSVITVEYLGEPDYGAIISAYIGSALMGAGFLAIACCCSALTKSQVVAFILASSFCVLLVLIGSRAVGEQLVSGLPESRWLVEGISSIGVGQYYGAFRRGVIELRSVFYFVALIGSALFINQQILVRRQR